MPSQKAIQNWLVLQIADILSTDHKQIDVRAPFSSYGLSSKDAVLLSGDLEDWMDRRLSPTIVYEYSTIETLSIHLSEDGHKSGEEPSSEDKSADGETGVVEENLRQSDISSPVPGSMDETVTELEQLSDEEVEALLIKKLNKLERK
ncbi:MAG: acyl carrier protein [Chloroflexota bacterium]|nr:acyl carrier protein [Chloroflexota bacterium]